MVNCCRPTSAFWVPPGPLLRRPDPPGWLAQRVHQAQPVPRAQPVRQAPRVLQDPRGPQDNKASLGPQAMRAYLAPPAWRGQQGNRAPLGTLGQRDQLGQSVQWGHRALELIAYFMITARSLFQSVLLLAALVGPSWSATSSSAGFQMQADGLDTSGGLSASSSFSVNACLGAAVVGSSASGSYKLDAGCAPLVSLVAATIPPVNGVCAAPAPSLFPPDATSLCSAGTAGSVTAGTGWQWSCTGSNGGSTASCSSDFVNTVNGSGQGWAVLGGTTGWQIDAAETRFVDSSGLGTPPQGYRFPHGFFRVRLITGPAGTGATVTLTYPSALPPGTVYWKFGPTSSNRTPHWYVFPGAVISGATVTLSLTDGADGDADLLANSVILDPGGPGYLDASLTPIPTLSQWAMLMLVALLIVATLVRHKGRWRSG